MTGMKEGAGEDPFAEDTDSTTADEQSEQTDPGKGETAPNGSRSGRTGSERAQTGSTGRQTDTRGMQHDARNSGRQETMQIPYKFRRDGVQDGRDRVPLFLQDETKRAERDALRELEERFDADVALTDLREALVKAGLRHLDEVEETLEAWGYGMTFEE